jgi:DNA-binding transcriptional regulator GbsR (MarR family)
MSKFKQFLKSLIDIQIVNKTNYSSLKNQLKLKDEIVKQKETIISELCKLRVVDSTKITELTKLLEVATKRNNELEQIIADISNERNHYKDAYDTLMERLERPRGEGGKWIKKRK